MDKDKHLQPRDYDRIISDSMMEPDYNISAYLESKFTYHYPANVNFMQGIEAAFDREEGSAKYDNVKLTIAANNGGVSDDRLDKLKLIAMWGEGKKQQIMTAEAKAKLDHLNQNYKQLVMVLHEAESAPDFKRMFVIDPAICGLQQGNMTLSVYGDKAHRFNISNKSEVDESGIVHEASAKYYISELIFLLSESSVIKTSEIQDFLEYHYQNADDKEGLINFITFDLWDHAGGKVPAHRKEQIMQWTARERHQNRTKPTGLRSVHDASQLNLIFDRLLMRKIVRSGDRIKFTAMFTDKPMDAVYWNIEIRGAKSGLFDLMQRITGKQMTAAMLKLRYRANDTIHDNWKDKDGKPSKLIDEILTGI